LDVEPGPPRPQALNPTPHLPDGSRVKLAWYPVIGWTLSAVGNGPWSGTSLLARLPPPRGFVEFLVLFIHLGHQRVAVWT
jgi:hypothetical protein